MTGEFVFVDVRVARMRCDAEYGSSQPARSRHALLDG
jgi:hypothetical protein